MHYPGPVLPLTESFCIRPIAVGCERGFAEWSAPMRRVNTIVVDGWVYTRVEPVGGEPPRFVLDLVARFPALGHLWRLNGELRRRIVAFDRFVRSGGLEEQVPAWEREWKPEAGRRLEPFMRRDLTALTDDELVTYLDGLHGYLEWAWSKHVPIHLLCFWVRGRFVELCEQLFGLTAFEAYELLQRTDDVLLAGTKHLTAMARRATEDQRVLDALARPADQVLDELRGTWFEQDLEAYLDAEGDRPVEGFDIANPTWREMPELVVGMVKGLIESPYDPAAEEAAFEASRAARVDGLRSRLTGDDLATFDRWLRLGMEAYPLNETHNYLLAELPWGLVRYAVLEAGRRLASRDRIETPEDVFHLYREELTAALRNPADLHPIITTRREAHERHRVTVPPPRIGREMPDPPVDAFPEAVAHVFRIALTQADDMYGAVPVASGPDDLQGNPGSPGVAEGTVRVVLSPEGFSSVREGDVLVCPMTTPAWTVLFPRIAGLITDSGGALSHAAIVAREYGVPSVVGTLDATRRLRDGDRVRLDGTAGIVHILRDAAVAST